MQKITLRRHHLLENAMPYILRFDALVNDHVKAI